MTFDQIYERSRSGDNEQFDDVAVQPREERETLDSLQLKPDMLERDISAVPSVARSLRSMYTSLLLHAAQYSPFTVSRCCIRVSKLNRPSRLKPCVTVPLYVCLGCLSCGLKEVQARRVASECSASRRSQTRGRGEHSTQDKSGC